MEVRRLGPGDEDVLRAVRLAALRSDPTAFGSTLAREAAFVPEDWTRRLGPPSRTFVAVPPGGDAPVGMAWAVPDADDLALVHLFGMWVAAGSRGSGAADALVAAVVGVGRDLGRGRVELTVVAGNVAAERLYRRHGFVPTGASEVRGRDALVEHRLALAL